MAQSTINKNQYFSKYLIQMNFTFTTNHIDFLPRFYRLSWVTVLSNMMVPLAGICDTAFLGHLSKIQPLAGVILASILFDYLYRVLKFLRNR